MADNPVQYQKVLQLYRSTNIWDTKNKAKAEVEIHAKQLHSEITAMLRDGEPIIAKYYDFGTESEGYKYKFTYSEGSETNPYSVSTSATHVWVDGFDSFKSNEFDSSTGKIKGVEPNYDSPAYIRVGESGDYAYYTLEIDFEDDGFPEYDVRNESAVFGVALIHERNTEQGNVEDYFIEWFDSAAEAKGAISELNYNDKDLAKGFVAKVNQKDGKIEAIHGNITGQNATVVTDNAYSYVKLTEAEISAHAIPDDYIWITGTNEGATLGTASESAPKFYHVTGSGETAGYYELRKNVSVTLKIDNNETVVWQDTDGLKTTIAIHDTTASEQNLDSNILKRYRLQGIGNTNLGVPIDIYKDSSLLTAYIGTTSDKFSNGTLYADDEDVMFVWTNSVDEDDKIYTKTKTINPETDKAYRKSTTNDYVYGKETQIDGFVDDKIVIDTKTYGDPEQVNAPCVIDGATDTESLSFIYVLADGTYQLVNINIENFLQESEFGDGLKVTNHVVSTKLDDNGGITFGDEAGHPTVNKSLKIKIDTTDTNSYYEQLPDSTSATHRYDPSNTSASSYDNGYVTIAEASQSATGYYKKDTYLHTTSDGLAVDQDVLKNKITDNISKVLYVNGQQFIKDTNGDIKAVVNGEQITVAGASSTTGEVEMTTITPVEGTPVTYDTNPTASANTPVLIYNSNDNYLYKKANSAYSKLTVTDDPAYIEVNGLIYKYDGSTGYKLFFIDKDTNLNDATAILNYLTYNLDMGQFTIQYQ